MRTIVHLHTASCSASYSYINYNKCISHVISTSACLCILANFGDPKHQTASLNGATTLIPDEILLVATHEPIMSQSVFLVWVIHGNKCRSVQLLGHHSVPYQIYQAPDGYVWQERERECFCCQKAFRRY